MLNAHDLSHVGSVLGKISAVLSGRIGGDEVMAAVQTHHAAGLLNGAHHVIGEVADMVAHGAAVGVGSNNRLGSHLDNATEAAGSEVGDIHQDLYDKYLKIRSNPPKRSCQIRQAPKIPPTKMPR